MKHLDKIIIKGLNIFAYHGVNPEEKQDGQNFIVDIDAYADLEQACLSDDLSQTVSYAKIIKTVKKVMLEDKYDLLERALQRIAEQILEEYPLIKEVSVTLKKPEAPISAVFDYVAAEITRKRGG